MAVPTPGITDPISAPAIAPCINSDCALVVLSPAALVAFFAYSADALAGSCANLIPASITD